MKAKINFDKAPILKVLNSEDETSRKSFGPYDEEPTMLMSAYNRQSFGKSNLKLFGKYQNQLSHRAHAKLVTCESNLMESSPQRSQSSGFDGEFVCKYLTPIKKQQFNELLFKDQINQQTDNDRNASRKSLDNKKTHKIGQRKQQNIEQNASFTKDRVQILQYSNMIKSFKPCSSIHEINQISASLKTDQSNIKIQNSPLINSGPSAFVDINAQVSFLKSNNSQLYQKLMKQIEKNKALEDKVKKIQDLNQQLALQNEDKQSQINYLKKAIIKYEQQKKKYLQKEWEQFHFVKELLNQKRKSKSKNKKHSSFIKPQINIIQTDKMNLYEKCPNEKLYNQKRNSKQLTQIKNDNNQSDLNSKRCFSSGKISPLCQGTKKVKSECDNKIEKTQKKRRLSFENLSETKRLPSQNKQNHQVQKILFNKLLVERQASSSNKMSLLQQKKRPPGQNSSAKLEKRGQSRIDKQKH